MAHYWLLDVDAPGVRLRYTTAPGPRVISGVTYRPGLDELEAATGDEEVDVSVLDPAVDWAGVAGSIAMVPCTLRRWLDGSALASSAVVARGAVSSLEYGSSREPVAWTMADRSVGAIPACPSPDAVVDTRSSPQRDPPPGTALYTPASQVGMRMPIVFGWPGHDYVGGIRLFPVVPIPCWQVPEQGELDPGDLAQIVISEDPRTTRPTRVMVSDGSGSAVVILDNTLVVLDKLGHQRLVADFTSAAGGDPENVYPDQDDAGDIEAHYSAGYSPAGDASPMRDLFDVVSYMVDRFAGSTADRARIAGLGDFLSGYNVDDYVNEDCGEDGVWAWLADRIRVLPIEIRHGPSGRYLQPISAVPDPRRVVRELDVSKGRVTRASAVTFVGDSPFNEFVGRYGLGGTAAGFTFFGSRVVGAVDDASVGLVYSTQQRPPPVYGAPGTLAMDTTIDVSYQICVTSQARYGRRPAPETTIPWTWDPDTCVRVLQARADREALPYRRVRYLVPETLGIEEDMHVRIVDDEVGLDTLAIVQGAPLLGSAAGSVVTLRIPGR